MPRIAGVSIPKEKRIEVALTYIYGIGRSSSKKILENAKISLDKRVEELNIEEINLINKIIEKNYSNIESSLRTKIMANIRRMKDIKCLKGIRHIKKLPVRGQRTRTNSRTVRGRAKITMGSGRIKQSKK